jgi:hypothetical protein
MYLFSAVAALWCIGSVGACFYFLRLSAEGDRCASALEDWFAGFSIDTYRPLQRLLSDYDFRLLQAQPALASRHRRKRYHLFREYLSELQADYSRAFRVRLFQIMRIEDGAPALYSASLRQHLQFHACLLEMKCRATVYRWGGPGVDACPLLYRFDIILRPLPQALRRELPAVPMVFLEDRVFF